MCGCVYVCVCVYEGRDTGPISIVLLSLPSGRKMSPLGVLLFKVKVKVCVYIRLQDHLYIASSKIFQPAFITKYAVH